jgi:hypothetical protein
MRKEVKNLYQNCMVQARDYEVQSCVTKKENMEIYHEGEKMTLTPEELVSKKVDTSKVFESKFGGKSYRLLGYIWKPDPVEL